MKKVSLLILGFLLAVPALVHANEYLKFELGSANKEWNGDNITLDATAGTFSYTQGAIDGTDFGNAAISWLGGVATDISGYDNLVLELAEPCDQNVEIVVANDGFWDAVDNYSTILSAGKTKISLKLSSMVKNGDAASDGSALDLTKVNLIFLRTAWTHTQIIKIKDFYLEKVTDPVADLNIAPFPYTASALTLNGNSYDETTNTITFTGDLSPLVGWEYPAGLDVSAYKWLVIVPRTPIYDGIANGPWVNVNISDGTHNFNSGDLRRFFWSSWRIMKLDLANAQIVTYTDASGNTIVDYASNTIYAVGDMFNNTFGTTVTAVEHLDLQNIKSIMFSAGGNNGNPFEIGAVYLTNTEPLGYIGIGDWTEDAVHNDYMRTNTVTDKYYTLCLPYNAAVCGAEVYEVAGVDNLSNPTTVYLNIVNGLLTAGKSYLIRSNSTKNITAYRAGSDQALNPVLSQGLQGVFSETTLTSADNALVLNGNKWYKVNSNVTVPANCAYINLSTAVTTAAAKSMVAMSIANGEVTAIDDLKIVGNDAPVYSITGMKVTARLVPGIYVKNGKKFIVK